MIRRFATLLGLLVLIPGSTLAHGELTPSDQALAIVAAEADQVVCRAREIKQILKPELRGTPCYLKMRVTNAKIHSTATRVWRRADHCWKARWEHEFDRLDSLLCELNDRVYESYRASAVSPCPWGDCLDQISIRISEMTYRVACMRAVLCGGPAPSPANTFEFAPDYPPAPLYPATPYSPSPATPSVPANPVPSVPADPPSVLLPPTTLKTAPLPPPPFRRSEQVRQRPPVDIARGQQETGEPESTGRRSVLESDSGIPSIPILPPQSNGTNRN